MWMWHGMDNGINGIEWHDHGNAAWKLELALLAAL